MSRKYVLSGLSVVVSLVLCVFYIFASVLKTPLLQDAPTITVSMNRTGGLFEGSLATYRGVRVGKVTKLELTPEGVRATVRLSGDEQIPRDSDIKVRSLSPVGEQYLDFQPRSAKGPYLEDGDDVAASAVDLPQTLGGMAITLNKLIEQVDPQKVETVLDELSTGLQGTEGDLQTLVEDGSDLLATLDENWPVTERLLGNGRTLLRIGVDHSADISRIARSSKLFAAWLRANDPILLRLLSRAPGQVDELRRLVQDVSQTLPQLLDPLGHDHRRPRCPRPARPGAAHPVPARLRHPGRRDPRRHRAPRRDPPEDQDLRLPHGRARAAGDVVPPAPGRRPLQPLGSLLPTRRAVGAATPEVTSGFRAGGGGGRGRAR